MAWVTTPPTQTQTPTTGWVSSVTVKTTTPQRGWVGSGQASIMGRLDGIGQLAALLMPRPYLYPELAGGGALAATHYKREFILAALDGEGTASAVIKQIDASAVEFASIGFLDANLVSTIIEVAFSGEGFFAGASDGLSATAVPGFTLLYDFTGLGSLAAVAVPGYVVFLGFDSSGALTAVLAPIVSRTVGFSSFGLLAAAATKGVGAVLDLAGEGTLSATAFIPVIPVLSGTGTFTPIPDAGHHYQDSFDRIPSSGALAGAGTLSAAVVGIIPRTAPFAGTGILATLFKQIYAITPALGGNGTLAGTGFARYASTPPLGASGTLASYTTAGKEYFPAFGGGGVLAGPLVPLLPVALAGGGTLAVATQQVYALTPALGGEGTLSATVLPIVGVAVDFSGEGTLAATANDTNFLIDTFTDTNGVLFTAHVGEAGASWARHPSYTATGQYTVQTNRVFCSTANAVFYASGVPPSADYKMTATVRFLSTGANINAIGVTGRMSTTAHTFYMAFFRRVSAGGGTWSCQLGKYVNGTFTGLGAANITTPATNSDHTIELRMAGDQISLYYDGGLLIGPVTDAAIAGPGQAGVYCDAAYTTTTGQHLDSVSAVTL